MINARLISVLGKNLSAAKIKRSFNSSSGWRTTYFYEGTERAVSSFMPILRASKRGEWEMDLTGPKATLVITVPDSGDQSEKDVHIRYELNANISQKSLYEHWRTLRFAAANPAELIAIRAALQDPKLAAQNPNATTLPDPNTQNPITLSADGAAFYKQMLHSGDAFVFSNTVMKVTIIAAKEDELQAIYANTNYVYSTLQMLGEIGDVAPYGTAAREAVDDVQEFYDQGGGVPANQYLPGWLKHAPTITPIAGEKDATTVEFWLESWSKYNYGFVAGATDPIA